MVDASVVTALPPVVTSASRSTATSSRCDIARTALGCRPCVHNDGGCCGAPLCQHVSFPSPPSSFSVSALRIACAHVIRTHSKPATAVFMQAHAHDNGKMECASVCWATHLSTTTCSGGYSYSSCCASAFRFGSRPVGPSPYATRTTFFALTFSRSHGHRWCRSFSKPLSHFMHG